MIILCNWLVICLHMLLQVFESALNNASLSIILLPIKFWFMQTENYLILTINISQHFISSEPNCFL